VHLGNVAFGSYGARMAIRRFRIGIRLFRSATCPSIWQAHGSTRYRASTTLPPRNYRAGGMRRMRPGV
jgi:hypothetical protein